jgi:hypothetical protein
VSLSSEEARGGDLIFPGVRIDNMLAMLFKKILWWIICLRKRVLWVISSDPVRYVDNTRLWKRDITKCPATNVKASSNLPSPARFVVRILQHMISTENLCVVSMLVNEGIRST